MQFVRTCRKGRVRNEPRQLEKFLGKSEKERVRERERIDVEEVPVNP